MMTMSKPKNQPAATPKTAAKSVLEQSLSTLWQKVPHHATQMEAFQAFEAAGMPSRRHEAWKYIQLERLLRQSAVVTAVTTQALPDWVAPLLYTETTQSRVILINGVYAPSLSTLPAGVTCTAQPVATTTERITTLAQSNPLVWLNQAFAQETLRIEVATNTTLNEPIQVLSLTVVPSDTAPAMLMTQPRVDIALNAYAKATVILTSGGDPSQELPYWTNALTGVTCAEGAKLNLSLLQSESPTAFYTGSTLVELAPYSDCQTNTVGLSGQLARHQLHVLHQGAESHSMLYGLSVLDDAMQSHHHTVIEHTVSHARSEQVYKAVLDGESRCEFDGSVWIHPDAQHIDAAQLNKNLLMSDKARVFTRPQLKIDADDVKCAHGATVGQLNETELFYLQSRGLDAGSARTLLTQAFAQDLVDKLPIASCRAHVMRVMIERLHITPLK